jgi:hypothetical protein
VRQSELISACDPANIKTVASKVIYLLIDVTDIRPLPFDFLSGIMMNQNRGPQWRGLTDR